MKTLFLVISLIFFIMTSSVDTDEQNLKGNNNAKVNEIKEFRMQDKSNCRRREAFVNGTCKCFQYFEGKGCNIFVGKCEGCQNGICRGKIIKSESKTELFCKCHPSWTGVNCTEKAECRRDSNCRKSNMVCIKKKCVSCPICENNGLCRRIQDWNTKQFVAKCVCRGEWAGENCLKKKICREKRQCNSNGDCTNYECKCYPEFTGTYCENYKGTCPNNCNGNGICKGVSFMKRNSEGKIERLSKGYCKCKLPYLGDDCSKKSECPNGCSGHGNCINSKCYCLQNNYGDDCSKNYLD